MPRATTTKTHARALCLAALALAFGLAACQGPEDIVVEAIEAAREGDREAYAACFTERSRPILSTWWDAADRHNPPLGRLGASPEIATRLERVVRPRDFGPSRATVLVEEAGQRMKVVLHELAGTWRIDLIDTERELVGTIGYD